MTTDEHRERVRLAADRVIRDDAGLLAKLKPYDETHHVVAWSSGPYWLLEVGDYGMTQAVWWSNVEYMARDYLVCHLDLDHPEHLTVSVTRAIGPERDEEWSWPTSWLWAWYGGVFETIAKWRTRAGTRY